MPKIDRVLSPSEVEALVPQNISLPENQSALQSSHVISDHSGTDNSSDTVHIEVKLDDSLSILSEVPREPPIEIQSDSDSMEIEVLSEPESEPPIPKPMKYMRVQPSKRFLRKLAQKNSDSNRVSSSVNKREIAEKLKKINRQLNMRNRMMSAS